jgi:general secretion pathway protein M
MRLHENEAKAAGQRADATHESGSLLTVVANSAAHAGLLLLRYHPEGSGGVSVVLQNQSFDSLITWIAELEQDDHVTVKQISVDAQTEPGLVNARIILM